MAFDDQSTFLQLSAWSIELASPQAPEFATPLTLRPWQRQMAFGKWRIEGKWREGTLILVEPEAHFWQDSESD